MPFVHGRRTSTLNPPGHAPRRPHVTSRRRAQQAILHHLWACTWPRLRKQWLSPCRKQVQGQLRLSLFCRTACRTLHMSPSDCTDTLTCTRLLIFANSKLWCLSFVRSMDQDMSADAALIILGGHTDSQICTALQNRPIVRARLQRILRWGPPPTQQAQHATRQQSNTSAQQAPWPDGDRPAMSDPIHPQGQFGGGTPQQAPQAQQAPPHWGP